MIFFLLRLSHTFWLALSLLFVLSLSPATAHAQKTDAQKTSPTTGTPSSSPSAATAASATVSTPAAALSDDQINLTLLTDQGIATQRTVEQLSMLMELPSRIEDLQHQQPIIQKQLSDLRSVTVSLLDDDKTRLEQLRNAQSEWRLLQDSLVQQHQQLRDHAQLLEQSLAQLTEEQAKWEKLSSSSSLGKSSDIRKAIQRAQADLAATSKAINVPLKTTLKLVGIWLEWIDTTGDNLVVLTQRERSARKDLFGNLQPPLWELSAENFHVQNGFSLALQQQLRFTHHYLSQHSISHMILACYIIAIFVLLWRMKTRQQQSYSSEQTQNLRFALLDRPFSTNIATSTLLALFLYQHPPALMQIGLAILLFVPVVRLGLPLIDPGLRLLVWSISLLYVVNSVSTLAEFMPGIQRLWIVFCAGFTAAIMRHALLNLRRNARHPVGHFWRNVHIAGGLSIAASLLALVSGVIGATHLAQFLNLGMVNTAYAALCLTVATGTLIDLLGSILYLPSLSASYIVRRNRHLILPQIKRFSILASVLLWLYFAAQQFYLDEPITNAFHALINSGFHAGNLNITVGSLLAIGITIWLSLKLSTLIRFVLLEDVAPRAGMSRGVPEAMAAISHYGIILVGFLLAISAAGIDLSKIAILAGALGVGIGIGLQDVVNNFTSGLILLFEQHIKPGDVIQCSAVNGRVTSIGLRCSIVRVADGAEVIVPNGQLVSAQVINWTHSDQERRVTIPITVSQHSDPDQVIATLVSIAQTDPDVLQDPLPTAFLLRFGPNGLDFELRAWLADGEFINETTSRLCSRIVSEFRQQGIAISLAQRDVYLHNSPAPASR